MLNHRKRQIYVFRGAAAVRHAHRHLLKRKAHLPARGEQRQTILVAGALWRSAAAAAVSGEPRE